MNWQEFHKWRKSVYKTTEANKLILRDNGLFKSERLKLQANGQNWQRKIRQYNNIVIIPLTQVR